MFVLEKISFISQSFWEAQLLNMFIKAMNQQVKKGTSFICLFIPNRFFSFEVASLLFVKKYHYTSLCFYLYEYCCLDTS